MGSNVFGQVEKWKEQLLDTGKRNQMINFKYHKASTMRIFSPQLHDLSNVLGRKGVQVQSIFENALKVDEFDDSESEEGFVSINGRNIKIKDSYDFSEITDLISEFQGLNKTPKIFSNLGLKQEKKVLRSLKSKAKAFKEEYGIDILYLAIGILNWYESLDSQNVVRSPLVLIPVKIEQQGFDSPYKLNFEDLDFFLNEALIKRIDSDFKLDFNYENELNSIDDVQSYFRKIKTQFNDHRWNIVHDLNLGLFSFSKISMVKDIETNESEIIDNEIIKALSGDSTSELMAPINYDEKTLDELMIPENTYQIYDADSSQENAIQAAIDGRSFVLQGPPGTGKSQTITNIISELIARGKKVLFVAEKKAALDVVYSNLEKQNLHQYALPLHNSKVNKKELISDLNSELERRSHKEKIRDEDLQNLFDDYYSAKSKLNEYAQILLNKNSFLNKSLYQIYGLYYKHHSSEKKLFFDLDLDEVSSKFTSNQLSDLIQKIELGIKSFSSSPYHSIWWGIEHMDLTYSKLEEYNNKIKKTYTDLDPLFEDIEYLYHGIQIDNISYERIIRNADKLLEIKLKASSLEFENDSLVNLDLQIEYLKSRIKAIENFDLSKKYISENFDETIIELLDYKEIIGALRTTSYIKKTFSNKYKRPIGLLKSYSSKPLNKSHHQEALLYFKKYWDNSKIISSSNSDFINENYTSYNLNQLKSKLNTLKWIKTFQDFLSTESFNLVEPLNQEYFDKLKANKEKLINMSSDLSSRINHFDLNIIDIFKTLNSDVVKEAPELNLFHFKKLISEMIDEYHEINAMVQLKNYFNEAYNKGLKDFLNQLKSEKITNNIEGLFFGRYYTLWIDKINLEFPTLRQFSREEYDEIRLKFAESDRKQIRYAKDRISERLDDLSPLFNGFESSNSEMTILKREAGKSRNVMPVRKLFQTIPNLILDIKPIIMMSPLSVSTYLNNESFKFDTVIFDEASQIRPESSIGAIYRSKQAIIVGDKKQLPPTNFFNNMDEEDSEEEYSAFSSILDLADTALTSVALNWHYRSKFEELIYISNQHIYKNLITFPSESKPKDDEGVTFKFVSNATYLRGKGQVSNQSTNPKEAEYVVNEIFDHFKKYGKSRSLGVVTFNSKQQVLIENMVNKRRRDKDEFSELFDSNKVEPFFIKNIETVQGDERDTIILNSVYGYDEHKKLSMNFGPLNHEEGYRRLNVAITRAKINNILVTSLRSSDIDLSKSDARGLKLFKEYLEFAEFGQDIKVDLKPESVEFDSVFEEEVYQSLTQKGFQVAKQIGSSGYRIDLAIRDAKNPRKYLLGIECDGATYHSSYSARVRDRLRQDILESRGWKIHRIWSTDWFKNKEKEINRISDLISNNVNIHVTKESVVSDSIIKEKVERQVPELNFERFPSIEELYEEAVNKYDTPAIVYFFERLAPFHEETIKLIVPPLYDRNRYTSYTNEKFLADVKKFNLLKYYGKSDGFVVKKDSEYNFRKVTEGSHRRNIEHIHLKELNAGFKEVLKHAKRISEEDLIRTLLTYTGFSKLTKSAENRMIQAIDLFKYDKNVKFENNYLIWVEFN